MTLPIESTGTRTRAVIDSTLHERRYRRRILTLGGLALLLVFLIGALIFIPVVQNDLSDRVEDRLTDRGIEGVSAAFSGQDGTLSCASPLEDPDAVERIAEELWGVRVIDLDRSCTTASATAAEPGTTTPESTDSTVEVVETVTSGPGTQPEPDQILDLVDGDPLFDQLSAWIETAGLDGDDSLGGDGPFTFFAPTSAAFDSLFDEIGADGFEALNSDPEMLRAILLHHVAEGELRSPDLASGPLTMLDGTDIDVDVDALTFTSGSTVAGVDDPPTELDIVASNGVIHAIDRILLPADISLTDPNAGTTTVNLVDGRLVLTGDVQSEAQRELLLGAAREVVDAGNIDDQLVVDAGVEVEDAAIDRLSGLVSVMPPNLVSGTAEVTGDDLSLTGVYLNNDANVAVTELAGDLDASVDLSARDTADADAAQALQDELNEFVRLNPILFEPNSTVLTPEANVVIEQVAARASRLDGTSIQIIGHTDSDGDAAANQRLSEGRAAAVLTALVAQGLPAEGLQSEGRGAQTPILGPDGLEDKVASRRVEFVVAAL